jgi:hypothetical protein
MAWRAGLLAVLGCIAMAAAAAPSRERLCGGMSSYARVEALPGGRHALSPVSRPGARTGNALSPYWQTQGMASLGGMAFCGLRAAKEWVDHLRKDAPAGAPCARRAFRAACDACRAHGPDAHKCDAWTHIVLDIQRETRAALVLRARDTGAPLPWFGARDAVVQQRRAEDTLADHEEYGPQPWSFYDPLADERPTRIVVVGDARAAAAHAPCAALNASLFARLRELVPGALLEHSSGSVEEDFPKLVFAPVLYKEASSFDLWAALANTGTVHSAPIYPSIVFDQTNWRWSRLETLYPSAFRRAGIARGDAGAIVACVERQ